MDNLVKKLRNQQLTTHNSQLISGFTLIELLIAIAVIALVTAVLFPNFMGIRQRARDTQRKSDLSQLQKALELYKLDQKPQVYPALLPTIPANCGSNCWSSDGTCGTGVGSNIYMRKMPCDPGGLKPTYIYVRGTDTTTYALTACLENPVDQDIVQAPEPTVQACGANGTYTIHEP